MVAAQGGREVSHCVLPSLAKRERIRQDGAEAGHFAVNRSQDRRYNERSL